jgi:hypothetical protein
MDQALRCERAMLPPRSPRRQGGLAATSDSSSDDDNGMGAQEQGRVATREVIDHAKNRSSD